MKTVKGLLTKLKNQFKQDFEEDYLFLENISLNHILSEIEYIYQSIDKFIELDDQLEIIVFKRQALKLIKQISSRLDKREWNSNEELRIIGYLLKLKHETKQLYLLEVKGELRSEQERQAIAADIMDIQSKLTEHAALEQELVKHKKEFESLKSSLLTLQTSYNEVQEQADEITQWHKDISPLNDEIAQFANTANNNLNKITTLATTAENAKPKIEKYHEEIENMITLFKKQKENIQEIIEDANRASMAGSFKKQQDNINSKMKWADGFLIGSLIITASISLWGFNSSLIQQTLKDGQIQTHLDWITFFAKSAISLPFLIVAWIKAKERAYLFRLREDYAYKYASAMAFEGYRKQVQQQSPELEEQLLKIAVDNLGSNPTKVFEKDLKSTPLETIIDGVGERFDKAFDGVKGQVKDIPQKTKELINE
ncbi:hypothetical protein [Volucribacter amazonae]|uniref:Uncharacterized protein n=1 Tax=Volucribacter amazonae TaxID=256731 RepID=A0A9X4P8Q1_9PAST|nr:hypothetical protein [Volucribacter amazonae]MDG6894558.1 hypothetical protein [Volucribacter amazonae]